MVVRLDLKDDVLIVEKADHARVILKDAHAPIVSAKLPADFDRGGEYRLFEHVLERALAAFIAVANATGQRFMAAMLAPSLGDCFQLDVRGFAPQ